jgi:hypothetical protein
MQDVRVLRRQAGRRHGSEGKKESLIIHPFEMSSSSTTDFAKAKGLFTLQDAKSLFVFGCSFQTTRSASTCVGIASTPVFPYNNAIEPRRESKNLFYLNLSSSRTQSRALG